MQATMVSPVFVGGTGRSGTTIAGELIGQSSAYELVPIEVRFHTDPGGLPDLIGGHVDLDQFVDRMTKRWYRRPPNRNGPRGVAVITPREDFDAALARLRESFPLRPWASAGRLVRDLLDPVAERAGKPAWVEMTPPVAAATATLGRMLPDAKFVHMVRDGRDVASSVVQRRWGPDDLPSALTWWAEELITIARAHEQVAADRVLNVRIESLVGPRREAAYARLLAFLGIDDEPRMRAFFEETVTAGKARLGRWRHDRDSQEVAEVQRLYVRALSRLADAGVTLPSAE